MGAASGSAASETANQSTRQRLAASSSAGVSGRAADSPTKRLIASARQYYNACVRYYNTNLEQFPSVLIAGAMGLKHEQFFELSDPLERAVPGVS